MEHQFTSGKPQKPKEPTEQGELFGEPQIKERRNFIKDYTSNQKRNLASAILEKIRKSIPLNEEETEYKEWSDSLEEEGGRYGK